MPIEILTPVGRIVWGNPAKPYPKKIQEGPDKGKPVLKDGQPVMQWAFGVAFPKAEFQQVIWPAMAAEAATGFPQGTPPKFAWKYQDGDGVDSNGQPFNKREGYAGHYILTISTEAFAPPIYKFTNGQYVQIDPAGIKCGDYIVVKLTIKLNIPADRTRVPSLFINPQGIELVGYGTEIVSGPDPMTMFGGQQRQLPPGASATPIASQHGVAMPGGPAQMQPGAQMPGYQPQPGGPISSGPSQMPGQMAPIIQPAYQQPQQPGQMPMQPQPYVQPQMQPGQQMPQYQPAHDFVANAGYQQPGMVQQPGQMQPVYQQPQQPGQMPMQPQYQPQPGHQMPGMIPPNR